MTHTNILSKSWYKNKKSTSEEERLRIVGAAAAIVTEDIRASVVETQSYPPPGKMFADIIEEIPNAEKQKRKNGSSKNEMHIDKSCNNGFDVRTIIFTIATIRAFCISS